MPGCPLLDLVHLRDSPHGLHMAIHRDGRYSGYTCLTDFEGTRCGAQDRRNGRNLGCLSDDLVRLLTLGPGRTIRRTVFTVSQGLTTREPSFRQMKLTSASTVSNSKMRSLR